MKFFDPTNLRDESGASNTRKHMPSSDPAVQIIPDGTLRVIEGPALARIATALEQLVALKLYDLQVPLPEVYAADPSGLVEKAILALAKEKMLEQTGASVQKLHAQLLTDPAAAEALKGASPSAPLDEDPNADPLFYDRVRQLAHYLNIPCDDLTDLELLAQQHAWTRETLAETLAGVGLL